MNITELSKKYDISVRTIRYYEEIGIIGSSRDTNNIRVYDGENENKLVVTLLLKELSIKLSDIREVVCGAGEVKLREMLISKFDALDMKINEIEKKKQLISSVIKSYGAEDITKRNLREFLRQQLYVSVKNDRLEKILMGDENIMIEIGQELIPIASKENDSLISAVKELRRIMAEKENISFERIRIKDNVEELLPYQYRISEGGKVIFSEFLEAGNEQIQISHIINSLKKHLLHTKIS